MKKETSTALFPKADTGVNASVSFWTIMVRVFNYSLLKGGSL